MTQDTHTNYAEHGYSPALVATIGALEQHAAELQLSSEAFASKHLLVSSTTWLRIRKGTYGGDIEAVAVKLEQSLRNLRIELARRARMTGNRSYYWFAPALAVMNAIAAARSRPAGDPERLVLVEGQTGSGKSALAAQIRVQHDAVFLEGRESWRTDYRAAATAIALAAGAATSQVDGRASLSQVEDRLLEALQHRRRVVVIDEGEYFGPKTANLIKLILNRTETVVVILCIPALRARWMQAAQREAQQLLRRAWTVDLGMVTPAEVEPFLAGLPLANHVRSAAGMIAKSANQFGAFSTVRRVVERLHDDKPEHLELADVAKAIEVTQLLQRRGGE